MELMHTGGSPTTLALAGVVMLSSILPVALFMRRRTRLQLKDAALRALGCEIRVGSTTIDVNRQDGTKQVAT